MDQQDYDDMALLLLYIQSWQENHGDRRAWKTFDYDILGRLESNELIYGNHRNKSIYISEAGVRRAKMILSKYEEILNNDG